MGYQYDIFISYPRRKLVVDWLDTCFLDNFQDYLRNSLPLDKELKIFLDREEIKTGDDWENRLKSALIHSRCILPIWLPDYFRSKWCLREINLLRHREKTLGYRTLARPSGLILPVRVFDGQHFPPFAKEINYFDCEKYYRVNKGFLESKKFDKYLDALIQWIADDVAPAIQNAPDWSNDWLSAQWIDEPLRSINTPTTSPVISQPIL